MAATEAQLAQLRAHLDKRDVNKKRVMASSNRALKMLQADGLLDEPAMYLANICAELDAQYGVGSTLCLDWMLDRYVAMEFERRVHPWFIEIWEALKAGGHTHRNQFEYHADAEAFYIPHETKRLVVMGSWWKYGGSKVLVIDNTADERHWQKLYVRRIWRRTKLSCGRYMEQPTLSYYRKHDFVMGGDDGCFYGDSRDRGHIMTYEKLMSQDGNCDKVIWDLQAPIRWFFNVNSLWTQLVGDPAGGSGLTPGPPAQQEQVNEAE